MAPEYLPNPNLDPRLFATLDDVEKQVAYEDSAYARLRADRTGTAKIQEHLAYQTSPAAHMAATRLPYLDQFHRTLSTQNPETSTATSLVPTHHKAHELPKIDPKSNPRIRANVQQLLQDPTAFDKFEQDLAQFCHTLTERQSPQSEANRKRMIVLWSLMLETRKPDIPADMHWSAPVVTAHAHEFLFWLVSILVYFQFFWPSTHPA